jgi:hypothetical protein
MLTGLQPSPGKTRSSAIDALPAANVDGVDQSCNTVYSVLQGGGAVVCPNNNCAPQWNGSAWTYFSAFADGTQGYNEMGQAPQQNSDAANGDPATAACICTGIAIHILRKHGDGGIVHR